MLCGACVTAGRAPIYVPERPLTVAVPSGAAQPTVAPRAQPPSRSLVPIAFPYTPQPEWIPTQTNYDAGRDGASIDYIVIHFTAISYARTLKAFNIPASYVSAHYVIRGDGHIAQIVGEADTAWHSGNFYFNEHSVGIELELDPVTNPAFTAEQYYAAAALACQIAARHGIPLDREHVIGHNEVPGSTHSDPGPTWGWPHFMYLTSLCAPPNASTVHASFVSETPFPDLEANETATISVVLQNTGATAWRKGTPQEARLAIPDNRTDLAFLGDGWPMSDRPAVQSEDIVPPGGTATFTFQVRGVLAGRYVLPLRGVVDGAAWMDDLGIYSVITVQ
jgi:N-acetyl-anhydromuramyl-L-alanine amidase AmpD